MVYRLWFVARAGAQEGWEHTPQNGGIPKLLRETTPQKRRQRFVLCPTSPVVWGALQAVACDRMSFTAHSAVAKPLRTASESVLKLQALSVVHAAHNLSRSRAAASATHLPRSKNCPPAGRTLMRVSRRRRLPIWVGERVFGEAKKGRGFLLHEPVQGYCTAGPQVVMEV